MAVITIPEVYIMSNKGSTQRHTHIFSIAAQICCDKNSKHKQMLFSRTYSIWKYTDDAQTDTYILTQLFT